LFVVSLLLASYIAVRLHLRAARQPPQETPLRIDSISGRDLSQLLVRGSNGNLISERMAGSRRVLYVFVTSCPACQAQKAHLGRLLSSLPENQVLTLSTEPLELLSSYWANGRPKALSIPADQLHRIGTAEVPTLISLDSNGIAIAAFVGSFSSWTEADLKEFSEGRIR
jgi:hypothetical protein